MQQGIQPEIDPAVISSLLDCVWISSRTGASNPSSANHEGVVPQYQGYLGKNLHAGRN
jgi:hypothetical protein